MDDRAAAAQIVAADAQIDVEQVLPRTSGNRARLELREIDVAKREHTQRLEERPRLVLQRERERRLVRGTERLAAARDDDEACDVVIEVLNAFAERLEAEELTGAA
jgi:hypothetical protein